MNDFGKYSDGSVILVPISPCAGNTTLNSKQFKNRGLFRSFPASFVLLGLVEHLEQNDYFALSTPSNSSIHTRY